ncbi:MAG: hypothetical protein ABI947_04560 [Chloroflexota bacterium]
MKRFLFGGSCLGMTVLCGLSAFIILLIGSMFFTQSQTNVDLHQAVTAHPLKVTLTPNAPAVTGGAEIGVTLEIPATSTLAQLTPDDTSQDSSIAVTAQPTQVPPFMTATPGNAPLGADVYELTVTTEIIMNRTKGAAERQKIWATRTAIADESRRIFATLTAEAELSATPVGQ